MLSLWALFLLSALIISWALDINARITSSGSANRVLEAEAMACSGAEIALHPNVKPGSPALHGGIGRGQTYSARITGEGGRLNLNWLAVGENLAHLEVLRKYLEIKGVDLNERDRMIDNLLDWVEPNTGLHHLNSDPETEDYHPAHKKLSRIEELKKIKGWEEFTSGGDWDSDLTLESSGPIDITWASREVLLALPGMTEQLVDQFLTLRRGPDGIDGTEDDAVFNGAPDALMAIGFSRDQIPQILLLLNPGKDPVLRVVSVGKSGDATRTVRLVFPRGFIPVQLKSWKEI